MIRGNFWHVISTLPRAERALASLSDRTQVNVLTHPPHLVGIACERFGQDSVAVAQLDARLEGPLAVTMVVSTKHASGRTSVPRERRGPKLDVNQGGAVRDTR